MHFPKQNRGRRRIEFHVAGRRSSIDTTDDKKQNRGCEVGVRLRTGTDGNSLVHERMYVDNLRPSNVRTQPSSNLIWPLMRFNRAGLKQRQYINWLAVYTYVGYAITVISYFSMCRPFTDYFAVPNPPGQGKSFLSHFIFDIH